MSIIFLFNFSTNIRIIFSNEIGGKPFNLLGDNQYKKKKKHNTPTYKTKLESIEKQINKKKREIIEFS